MVLNDNELSDIRDRTFVSLALFNCGVVQSNGSLRFAWSLEEIEEVQGHAAASANHCRQRKLQKRFERIYDKLQRFLDAYDDSTPEDRQ